MSINRFLRMQDKQLDILYIQWNSEKQIYLYRNNMVIIVKSNDSYIKLN